MGNSTHSKQWTWLLIHTPNTYDYSLLVKGTLVVIQEVTSQKIMVQEESPGYVHMAWYYGL